MNKQYSKCLNQYDLVCELLKEYENDEYIDETKTTDLVSQMKTLILYLNNYAQDLGVIDGKYDCETDVSNLIDLNDKILKLKTDMILAISH